MSKLTLLFTMMLVLGVSGCGTSDSKNDTVNKVEKMFLQKQSSIVFELEPTPALVSVKIPKDLKLEKKVNIAINQSINIIAAIDFADNTLSIFPDAGVDLDKKFSIKFNDQTLDRYFKYLENITGYQVELIDSIVYVRSIQSKTWDLQTLSMNIEQLTISARSEVSSNTDASLDVNKNWQSIVKNVETIMNSGEVINDTKISTTIVVTDNQQLGIISATGLPGKIKQVDNWLDYLINSSNRQIYLQVQVLDIAVDESIGHGIDWDLISKQLSEFQIGNNSQQVIEGAGIISIGTSAGTIIDLGKKITPDFMLKLLRRQGKVRVDNQPNITVTNGRQAFITTGDGFSYISSISSIADSSGGSPVVTSEVQRMSIGVSMRITPKILPDDRIVVSIVPVISSLKSFSTLTSSGEEFKTPNIELQKLATQVIVESGKMIYLGGLIASKIVNTVKNLPNSGIFDVFFRGTQDSFERREIIILVTPTIVS